MSGSFQGAGGVGGLLAVNVATNGVHFPAYDGNGNIAGLVSASAGTTTARFEYGPFAEPIRVSGPIAEAMPLRFSTKYLDDETGLFYYGYRYYDPSTGRWVNRDPIEEWGGKNLYSFLGNEPTHYVDPFGLACDFSGPLATLLAELAKDAGWDYAKKQLLKGGAKLGVAAVADGPLPIGEVVGTALLVIDVGDGIYYGWKNARDLKHIKEVLDDRLQQLSEFNKGKNAEKCCYVIENVMTQLTPMALDVVRRKRGTSLSDFAGKARYELDKAAKKFAKCVATCSGPKDRQEGGAEHTTGARGSTAEDHEYGQARKERDFGAEKGDVRRTQWKWRRK